MSEELEAEEKMETERNLDCKKTECKNNSKVSEEEELVTNNITSDVCYKIDKVFGNELLLSEILARLPVPDRKSAKSVCTFFRNELSRRIFIKKEFITIRETFTDTTVEKLTSLGLLDRPYFNLAFINVKSFKDQPKYFWNDYRNKIGKVIFKGCGINFTVLKLILGCDCQLLSISMAACFFDDESGWRKREVEPEDDPLLSLLRSKNVPNPKRSQGKLFFNKNVKEYVCRFMNVCSHMFVYADAGQVRTFVFNYNSNFIAFDGWNAEDITIYNSTELDANPKTLLGWNTFRTYLKTKYVDQNNNPRWVMVEISEIEHLMMEQKDPPVIIYMKNTFRL